MSKRCELCHCEQGLHKRALIIDTRLIGDSEGKLYCELCDHYHIAPDPDYINEQ